MPYILAPIVKKNMPGMWAEGSPYSTETIYDICSNDMSLPPVHYEMHALKPHSICHFDAPGHIIQNGKTIDELIEQTPEIFYGSVTVLNLKKPNFNPHQNAPHIQHWEVTLEELKNGLAHLNVSSIRKLFLTFEGAKENFFNDPKHALTLSVDAATWLTSEFDFNLFGTIWRSTDFQPGTRERPIHRILFNKGGILECINLTHVPEGNYFLSAFPIPLEGATESPTCPILYTSSELKI